MKNTTIALGMIIKNDDEAEMLERCLSTVAPHVDGIYLTFTQKPYKKLIKLANKYGANYDVRPGDFNYTIDKKQVKWLTKFFGKKPKGKAGDVIFDFGKARNANLDFIPDQYDWLFWMDTDDILRKGELLKDTANTAHQSGHEAVFFNYLYLVEMDGSNIKNVIIQHLRERMVRIKGDYRKVFKWIGAIHETLIQQRETVKVENNVIDVIHYSSGLRMSDAIMRNMRVLETEIYNSKGSDPRPIYYLAKAYYDLHDKEGYDMAEKLIIMYLSPNKHKNNMSGWSEERAQAWEYLAEIYRNTGRLDEAVGAGFKALEEYPQFQSAYLGLAVSFMSKQKYDIARFWAILSSKVPAHKSTLVSNPRDIEARTFEVIYNSATKLNKIDEAWAAMEKLKGLFPTSPQIDQQWNFISETREIRDQLQGYMTLVSYLNKTGQTRKIKPLLAAAPESIANNPMVVKLFQEIYPPRTHGKKEISFYCGQQFTPWGPKSAEDPGGNFVGGSEEAVIYLTEALSKQGWKVTVYADPAPDVGVFDGVEWKPYYTFNPNDTFNILVLWRAVGFIDMGVKAKKTYLWAHDVINPAEFNQDRLDKLEKVIVLSKAHRKNIPDVPDDKIMISTNGFYEYEK